MVMGSLVRVSRRVPLNSYKCRFGGSQSRVPVIELSSSDDVYLDVTPRPCRILRFVSPSRFDVSM